MTIYITQERKLYFVHRVLGKQGPDGWMDDRGAINVRPWMGTRALFNPRTWLFRFIN